MDAIQVLLISDHRGRYEYSYSWLHGETAGELAVPSGL
jgi:hypothetical protein